MLDPADSPREPRPLEYYVRGPADAARGLVCRFCACRHFNVVSTWHTADGAVKRRRVCRACGRDEFQTVERKDAGLKVDVGQVSNLSEIQETE